GRGAVAERVHDAEAEEPARDHRERRGETEAAGHPDRPQRLGLGRSGGGRGVRAEELEVDEGLEHALDRRGQQQDAGERPQAHGPERRTTRGQIVRRAAVGVAAGFVATGCRSQGAARAARARDRVVVVGAGVAGLTCAYRLLRHGIHASVYEASDRVGGRTMTLRGFFADGQIVEQGGEAIDTGQHAVRRLAAELGLHLGDTYAETPGGLSSNRFDFHRRRYTYARASRDFAEVYPALQRDLRAFARSPWAARELDEMSAADWIGSRVPGGNGSQLGRLIGEAYCSEDGVPIEAGSALAMITQLGESARRPLSLYGDSDERFKVHGGVDQIAHRLARRLPAGAVTMGTPLVGLRRNADRSYTCAFAGGREARADRVVLALPF